MPNLDAALERTRSMNTRRRLHMVLLVCHVVPQNGNDLVPGSNRVAVEVAR